MTVSESHAHLDLTPQEFERRLAACGHDRTEIRRLWDELAAEGKPAEPAAGLGLGPVIAVYLGLLLVVAAAVSLLAVLWDDLGPAGVLALAAAYVVASLGASEIGRRRGLAEAAGALEAVAVVWVGLATYAIQELAGLWPEGIGDRGDVPRGVTAIAVVALAAGVLLLSLRPSPLLFVPVAAATALLALDLAELLFGEPLDDLGPRQSFAVVLPVGLAWVAAGLWLDATRRRAYATWAHWCGLVITGVAVLNLIPKTVPGFALVGAVGAVSLFFSAFVRHWSFTVVGAFGVLVATAATLGELGGLAPVVIAAVGIALIVVGVRWSRWRETIRDAALARLPDGARELVRRLAP